MKNILDKKTGKIVQAYDFGGPDVIKVQDIFVYGDKHHNMTSYTKTVDTLTLEPIGESISLAKGIWEIVSRSNINTCNYRITIKITLLVS